MSPITETVYYSVTCDDCATKTGDFGDYSAWSDPSQAVEEWTECDFYTDDEQVWFLCDYHLPRCLCGAEIPNDDCVNANGHCEECADAEEATEAQGPSPRRGA